MRNRSWMTALLYWAGSAVLGIVCVQLGVILARLAYIAGITPDKQ